MKKISKSEQIVKQIEILLNQLKHSLNISDRSPLSQKEKFRSIIRGGREFSGLTGKIYELIEEEFFKKPKTISEIQKKLQDEGIKKPTTSLMPSLILLVRKKILGRNKPPKGTYKYYQR